jgi:hypothetical protein
MSQNNNQNSGEKTFALFHQRVLSDLSLQEKLREIEDKKEFIAATIALGAANGFVFSAAEIESIMRANQQQWIERWM